MLYFLGNILLVAALIGCALFVYIMIDKVYDVIEPHVENEISKETGLRFTSQQKKKQKKENRMHLLFFREVENAAHRYTCR